MAQPETPRRKRKRKQQENHPQATFIGFGMLLMSVGYLFLIYKTQTILDSIEERGGRNHNASGLRIHSPMMFREHVVSVTNQESKVRLRRSSGSNTTKVRVVKPAVPLTSILSSKNERAPPSPAKKFIVFDGTLPGQGIGNIVSGLLAAHLLGEEFNRTVCVQYESFLCAFEPINGEVLQNCPTLMANLPEKKRNENFIDIINYHGAADECKIQALFRSDENVIFLVGNTYPRWSPVRPGFFYEHYAAKPQLKQILPYNVTPTTVVHLREPDAKLDARLGLDEPSLHFLETTLPNGTFLVTNRVEWYDRFEKHGWSHPNWDRVYHTAKSMSWGGRSGQGDKTGGDDKEARSMHAWADWYTILNAKTVYHTHSDFSGSAVHWMGMESRVFQAYNATERAVNMIEESWRRDGETIPLRDRRILPDSDPRALRGCKNNVVK